MKPKNLNNLLKYCLLMEYSCEQRNENGICLSDECDYQAYDSENVKSLIQDKINVHGKSCKRMIENIKRHEEYKHRIPQEPLQCDWTYEVKTDKGKHNMPMSCEYKQYCEEGRDAMKLKSLLGDENVSK